MHSKCLPTICHFFTKKAPFMEINLNYTMSQFTNKLKEYHPRIVYPTLLHHHTNFPFEFDRKSHNPFSH